jgi:chondroitin AC lyase
MKKTIFLLLILCSGSIISRSQSLSDVDKIKSKLYQISLDRALPVDMTLNIEADEMLKTFDGSGSWPDINYQDKSASAWLPAQHLKRLFELSVQYRDKNSSLFGKPEVRDIILKGLQFWTNEPPHAANNWWNTIGVENFLVGIYVLMENELDNDLKAKGLKLMTLGVKPEYYDYYGKATGQNALWLASAHMYACCLTNDMEGLKRVFSTVAEEIVIADGEGIQTDYSFYQHGRQNYAFGYGKGFSETAAKYFFLANNTTFQFSNDKIDIFSNYLMQGQQWMSRYSYLEYTAMGRQISRKGIDLKPILSSLKWMMVVDPAKQEEYKAFYNRLSDNRKEKPLVGNRCFWRSDLMVHHRPNYYFSLKATSNRITSGESGNGENIKGWYQGNGTFYLIRSGNEYHEIFPIWNWRKLPGSLCSQKSGTLPLFLWGAGAQGATSFVYGLNDGMYGCFGYDYNKDNVTAKRAWFFFDNEILNLVSNVSGDSLYQSINQCLLNGEVWSGAKNKQGNIDRVFQDSVGYCINTTDKLVVKAENQTGSWYDINVSESAEPITKKVFSLGIDLGNKVVDKSYSYAILPAISLGDFKKYKLSNHVQILLNTKDIQAVFQKDIEQVQAVFYSAGKLDLPWNKLTIEMKKPGLVLIKKQMNNVIIDYSQPTDKKHVEFKLADKNLFQNDDLAIEIK